MIIHTSTHTHIRHAPACQGLFSVCGAVQLTCPHTHDIHTQVLAEIFIIKTTEKEPNAIQYPYTRRDVFECFLDRRRRSRHDETKQDHIIAYNRDIRTDSIHIYSFSLRTASSRFSYLHLISVRLAEKKQILYCTVILTFLFAVCFGNEHSAPLESAQQLHFQAFARSLVVQHIHGQEDTTLPRKELIG
jgi:hypothetical protein